MFPSYFGVGPAQTGDEFGLDYHRNQARARVCVCVCMWVTWTGQTSISDFVHSSKATQVGQNQINISM